MKPLLFCLLCLPTLGFAQDIDCEQAQTQSEMTSCAGQEYEQADAALNIAYRAVMEEVKQLDADLPKADRGAAEALLRAQRAWVTVRDETCTARGYIYHGGSAEQMLVLSCQAGMTRARTDELLMLTRLD